MNAKSPRPVLALMILSVVFPVFSIASEVRQAPEDYIQLLRVDLRARKAQIVMESMELTVDEVRPFAKIYGEYDKKLSRLHADRINVIREFAAQFASMDDAKARELRKKSLDIMHKRLDLLEKTAGRIEKEFSAVMATRFAQIENQLLLMIDVQLASEVPLIPREVLLPGKIG